MLRINLIIFEKFLFVNTPFLLAKKLIKSKLEKDSTSKPIIRVSVASIAIGIIVLILAIATGKGLEHTIRTKMQVYASPIQISHLNYYSKFDYTPISPDSTLETQFENEDYITSFHKAAYQSALIKNGTEVNPVVFKGYDQSFGWGTFEGYLESGRFPNLNVDDKRGSKEILISKRLAKKMGYSLNDNVFMFIIDQENQKQRVRKLTIVGIYNVGVVEFDDIYIYGDLRVVQKLNRWKAGEFAVWEININNYDDIDNITYQITDLLPVELRARQIRSIYPNMFVWIDMFDTNIYILLVIIGLVASINMISTILISILERTEMIGVLKSLGMNNKSLRSVFLYYMMYLVSKGLFIGNIIGLGICYIQYQYKMIPLDEESYHVAHVPIHITLIDVLALNLSIIGISLIVLLIPSLFIKYIRPVKILRFGN